MGNSLFYCIGKRRPEPERISRKNDLHRTVFRTHSAAGVTMAPHCGRTASAVYWLRQHGFAKKLGTGRSEAQFPLGQAPETYLHFFRSTRVKLPPADDPVSKHLDLKNVKQPI